MAGSLCMLCTVAALSAGATLPAATGGGPAYSERCVDSGSALLPDKPPDWGWDARAAAGFAGSACAGEDALARVGLWD